MPTKIHKDYETRAVPDIKDVGAYRYANDPSLRILYVAVAEDDGPVYLWTPPEFREAAGLSDEEIRNAEALMAKESDPEVEIWCHNSQFETAVTEAVFEKQTGFKKPALHQYRCTAAMARRAGLPFSLEKCAAELGLPQQKDKRGDALIKKFCSPQKDGRWIHPWDDPQAFREFGEYARQDVVVERLIGEKLQHFALSGMALEIFKIDTLMNHRGFPVNLPAIACAQELVKLAVGSVEEDFTKLTGLTPRQGEKFKVWLKERGYQHDNLQADTLDAVIEADDFDDLSELGQALLMRQRVSFAAVNKLDAMKKCAGPHDNRVRGTLLIYGTGPGRWAGSKVQPHNFKKPSPKLVRGANAKAAGFEDSDEMLSWLTASAYRDLSAGCGPDHLDMLYGPPLDVISSSIRHFIHDSRPMLDVDYSAIQARVLSWLAGEEWRMEVFRTHGKIYEASASQMFGVPIDQVSRPMRQKGKISELALGFAGSDGALITMGALKMGLKEEELHPLVVLWREANTKIVQFWDDSDMAARRAIASPGQKFKAGRITYFYARTAGIPYLFLVLPSGRKIAFPHPRIEETIMWKKDGEKKRLICPTRAQILEAKKEDPKAWLKGGLTYYGCIDKKSQRFGRVSLHPGKLAQNATMGVEADVLFQGMVNAHGKGYQLLLTVHDEVLSAYEPEKGQSLEEFTSLLIDMPAWADGLPVKADGAIVDFYTK
jgi:DNA polymerase